LNAPRPLRSFDEAESLRCDKLAPPVPPASDEFLPRSVLQDSEFSARLKREAHLMRNEAIRDALAALARWIVGTLRGSR